MCGIPTACLVRSSCKTFFEAKTEVGLLFWLEKWQNWKGKNAALKNFLWASKKSSQAEKQTERSLKKEEGKNRGLKRLEFKV